MMQKSLFVIQGIVVIHLMYGTIQWLEKGVFLPVIPLTALFSASITFITSGAIRNQRFQKLIWILLGTSFLLSSELVLETLFGQFEGIQIRAKILPIIITLISILVLILCFLFLKFIRVPMFLKGLYGSAVIFTTFCLALDELPLLVGLIVLIAMGQWMYLKDDTKNEYKADHIKLVHVSLQSVFILHALNDLTILLS